MKFCFVPVIVVLVTVGAWVFDDIRDARWITISRLRVKFRAFDARRLPPAAAGNGGKV